MDKSSQKKFFFREIYRFLPIVKEVRRYSAILATGKEGNWKIPLLWVRAIVVKILHKYCCKITFLKDADKCAQYILVLYTLRPNSNTFLSIGV